METDRHELEARLLSGAAWRDFCERLGRVGDAICAESFPQTPRERAEGFRWLTRLLVNATQLEIEAGDPHFPRFVRYETPFVQWGGPNPDNTYLRTNIDAACAYRVWADVSGVRQAIVSLHEGDMQLGEFGVYGEHSLNDLDIGEDGRLEIVVSSQRRPGNWIEMHPSARILTVRIYQSDWENDPAPVFHIERIDGDPVPPLLEPAALAQALERAANWVEKTATFWNAYTANAWEQATPNVATAPRSAPGGAQDILYGSCCWELAEDEVLLVETDVPNAEYWSFTIHTLGWLESGDFADRQTSLNHHQCHIDDDGRLRLALAPRDPGTPNWIDTEGRPRGMLVYRWVWSRDNAVPIARRLPLSTLRESLPADHPVVDPPTRRRQLARRREAAWNRFL
jgi:hypothetical protein